MTSQQTRWIERCAKRLKQLEQCTHMEAVQQAFNLYRAWPGIDPTEAADVFMAPDVAREP
jgi:hypothetical protein